MWLMPPVRAAMFVLAAHWLPRPRVSPRFSGLSRSDLVLWHITSIPGLSDKAAIEG
jgi:hypothetical protein